MRMFGVALLCGWLLPAPVLTQIPGVYELRVEIDPGEPPAPIGFFALAPDGFSEGSLPARFRSRQLRRSRWLLRDVRRDPNRIEDVRPNACFWFPDAPDSIGDREFYTGIVEVGITRWSEAGDTIRVPVYRSPDAAALLVGVRTEAGFEGRVWQYDWDGSRTGPWLPFVAIADGAWEPESCSELIRRAGW